MRQDTNSKDLTPLFTSFDPLQDIGHYVQEHPEAVVPTVVAGGVIVGGTIILFGGGGLVLLF